MPATQTDFTFNATAGGAAIARCLLVKISGSTVIVNTATSTDCPVGVTQAAVASSGRASIRDIKHGGTHRVTAAGAITAGADIYAAASGKVQALPGVSGTYRKVGVAIEAAAGNGSIFEAWLDPSGDTTVVSS